MGVKELKNYTQVGCYLTHEQHAALKKLSSKTQVPLSAYLRLAVEEFLARQAKRAKP